MNRSSRYVAVSLAPLLALLAACQGGSDEDPQEEPEPVAAEDLDSVSLPDDDLAELVDLMTEQMGTAYTVGVDMSVDPEAEEAETVEETTVDLRLSDPTAAVMEIVESDKEAPTTTDVVVLDGAIYTNLEGEEMVEGKPWLRLTHEDVTAVEGELGPFAQIFTTILDEVEASLEQASGSQAFDLVRYGELTEESGPADSDASLTAYTGETSAEALAEAGNEDLDEMAESGLDAVSWTITVTDKGLPQEYTIGMLTPDGEEATTTVVYRDWGQDLDIQEPSEENTATLAELTA